MASVQSRETAQDAAELVQTTNQVKVLVRFKPVAEGTSCAIAASSATTLSYSNFAEGVESAFTFDKVLTAASTQEAVFKEVRHVVKAALSGSNGTIMSYGQTGSGKTHTLMGDICSSEQRGIVPRAAAEIFQAIQGADSSQYSYTVQVSAVEIYCERIRDLLSFSEASENLTVQQDKDRGIFVAGAKQELISSESELLQVMQVGLSNRAVASTGMNAASSRSHCLVFLLVQRHWRDSLGRVDHGKLCLADLAGSERQDRTNAVGQALEEAKLINKSLSALGNVVSALVDSRRPPSYVPYRDSKLTRVLQDSLGGTAKTALIICCSPAAQDATESLPALRFGARAAGIVNAVQAAAVKPRVPSYEAMEMLEASLEAYKALCHAMHTEVEALREQLADQELVDKQDEACSSTNDRSTAESAPAEACGRPERLERIISTSLKALTLVAMIMSQWLQ